MLGLRANRSERVHLLTMSLDTPTMDTGHSHDGHRALVWRFMTPPRQRRIESWSGARDNFASHYFTSNIDRTTSTLDHFLVWRMELTFRDVGYVKSEIGALRQGPFNYSQAGHYCGTRMLLPSVKANLSTYASTSRDVDMAPWLSVRLAPNPLVSYLCFTNYFCIRI